MYKFNDKIKQIEVLTEASSGKNLHLEHLEDIVLDNGVAGTREAINFLQSLRDMLAGNSTSKVNITTKWDGAPAIFVGINPENKKFFVGTKSVFTKNAKLNYTNADIDKNHPAEGLNKKLKTSLRYLPKLGIKGILQGDMMFTKGDIRTESISGEKFITFTPNTITYAVPADSKLASSMRAAHVGIVFHTSYAGQTMEQMKASFNIDIKNLSTTKDVWFRDADFTDTSGTATFTIQETKAITRILSDVGQLFRQASPSVMNRIKDNSVIRQYIKVFNNKKVREGQTIRDTMQHTRQLILDVEKQMNAEILEAKRAETKRNRQLKKSEVMRFFRNNAVELKRIFDIQNGVTEAKLMIINKLQSVDQVARTFIKTDSGYRITAPEGFVAVDHLKGNAVKLVDRLEFSQSNFNAAKNWSK
tara:strand:- start:2020 stop:3270 length:1251 start_codon:yes stop_codon:yes gene_type:complete